MALWKPFLGTRAALDTVEKHAGYVYWCADDGSLHFDYTDADGVLQRKQINAKEAETLCGLTLDELKSHIATQDAVILAEAQAYTDVAIEELNEKIGEGVDISNLATVDKIAYMEQNQRVGSARYSEEFGIGITNKTRIMDSNDEILSEGSFDQFVPIVAGSGVEFEVDEENNLIKINATGGGSSSVSLIGTWTIIDEPEIPTSDLPLEFTSNGTEYVALGYTSMGSSTWGINALSYQSPEGYYDAAYTNNPSGSYGISHGWGSEAYKTITVTEEPTDPDAIAWLANNTNVPKVTPSNELPSCDSSNEGQFLRVINGAPAWTTVPNAEDNSF